MKKFLALAGFSALLLSALPAQQAVPENFTNSLGMQFVKVQGVAPLFSIYETRVSDYRAFTSSTNRSAMRPAFSQSSSHPAVNVSWEDASYFVRWLTEKERKSGKIPPNAQYRLPSSEEWSIAAGLSSETKESDAPQYAWQGDWPPPVGAGNYGQRLGTDGYVHTSPVGSFKPNAQGLHDIGGNVWEWCSDSFGAHANLRVLRGASWRMNSADEIRLNRIVGNLAELRLPGYGFRPVLEWAATASN